jgi:protease-4
MAAGCGSGEGGFLVRPVPVDQSLRESVIHSDGGLFLPKVAVVDVEGLIVNDRSGGGLFGSGENPVSTLYDKFEAAQCDPDVVAVVLRINSPGGTVQASETMYNRVLRFRRESHKPVIACITDVGASGGYYLACGADKIICQPTSITGSIGVLIQTVSFQGTMRLLGITAEAIASGPMKTMGSPLKELTEPERKVFQEMVNSFYERFVEVVHTGRSKLDVETVKKIADGRVYTGEQALKLGLVDQFGDVDEAVALAKKAAGVARAKVVMYHRPMGYRSNVYSAAPDTPAMQINLLNVQGGEVTLLRRPTFLYLWSTDLKAGENQ